MAPLTLLLLCSRPTSWREWIWILLGAAAVGYWIAQPGDIAAQSMRAVGALAAGAFAALTLAGMGRPVPRSLVAAVIAFVAFAAWCAAFHIGWADIRSAATHSVRQTLDAMATQAQPRDPDAARMIRDMSQAAPNWAALLPGVTLLELMAGSLLAWGLHRRMSARPLGAAADAFARFRFSDHLVWLVVAGLALVLFRLPPWVPGDLGPNLLLVGGTLYAARGLAVVRAGAGRLPSPTAVALGLVAVVLLPFVLCGLTLLGLADTWLDFRRRLAPPAT